MTFCLPFACALSAGNPEADASGEESGVAHERAAAGPTVGRRSQRPDLGRITGITGSGATARLFKATAGDTAEDARLTIGRLVGISVDTSLIVGVVVRMSVSPPPPGDDDVGSLVAEIDFMGEIKNYGTPDAVVPARRLQLPDDRQRSSRASSTGDIAVIHRIDDGETIEVGRLRLDPTVPAYINFEEMLRKHFAILGTTGVGKSIGGRAHPPGDPREEGQPPHLPDRSAQRIRPVASATSPTSSARRICMLPFWLFNFEEIVDVFFRGRPGVEEETEILSGADPDRQGEVRRRPARRARPRPQGGRRRLHRRHAGSLPHLRSRPA